MTSESKHNPNQGADLAAAARAASELAAAVEVAPAVVAKSAGREVRPPEPRPAVEPMMRGPIGDAVRSEVFDDRMAKAVASRQQDTKEASVKEAQPLVTARDVNVDRRLELMRWEGRLSKVFDKARNLQR